VHLFCVCVVLFVGSGLVTGQSLVQGVLPAEELLMNEWTLSTVLFLSKNTESSLGKVVLEYK
jgi:hypothetical protein